MSRDLASVRTAITNSPQLRRQFWIRGGETKSCNRTYSLFSPLPSDSLSLSLCFSLLSRRQRKSKFTLDKELRACWANRASSALFGIADKDPDYTRLALRVGDKGIRFEGRGQICRRPVRTRKTEWRKKEMPIARPVSPDKPNNVLTVNGWYLNLMDMDGQWQTSLAIVELATTSVVSVYTRTITMDFNTQII